MVGVRFAGVENCSPVGLGPLSSSIVAMAGTEKAGYTQEAFLTITEA